MDLKNFISESKAVVQIGSKKDLMKSAEYMEFLLRYSTVPGMEVLKSIIKMKISKKLIEVSIFLDTRNKLLIFQLSKQLMILVPILTF